MMAKRASRSAGARAGAGAWEVHAQVDSGRMAMAAAQRGLASNSSTETSRAATPTAEASTLMSRGSSPTARVSTVLLDPGAPRATAAVLNAFAPSRNPTPNLAPGPILSLTPSRAPSQSLGLTLGLRTNLSVKLDVPACWYHLLWSNSFHQHYLLAVWRITLSLWHWATE